jgi:SynChlorMet cassette protein ScmC
MINQITSYHMNMIKPILDNETGYCLRLANGQGWHISVSEQLGPWADKLAAIMQLRVCEPNEYPKLIFIMRGAVNDNCGEPSWRLAEKFTGKLGRWGWKAHDLGGMRLWSRTDVTDVICEIGSLDENLDIIIMRVSLCPIYQRAQDSGGLSLHAGLVERDGKGVLLAAPKNIGKSTCCERIPRPWSVLCDEETLVVQDNQRKYLVHPFPTWSDYIARRSDRTWNVQHHVALRAIFFLEQAEVDEVISLGQGEAAVLINQSAVQVDYRYWYDLDNEELRFRKKKLFENACELAKVIPSFKLRVSLKGRFWEKIEAVLP